MPTSSTRAAPACTIRMRYIQNQRVKLGTYHCDERLQHLRLNNVGAHLGSVREHRFLLLYGHPGIGEDTGRWPASTRPCMRVKHHWRWRTFHSIAQSVFSIFSRIARIASDSSVAMLARYGSMFPAKTNISCRQSPSLRDQDTGTHEQLPSRDPRRAPTRRSIDTRSCQPFGESPLQFHQLRACVIRLRRRQSRRSIASSS